MVTLNLLGGPAAGAAAGRSLCGRCFERAPPFVAITVA
jgi:hypothetical protein